MLKKKYPNNLQHQNKTNKTATIAMSQYSDAVSSIPYIDLGINERCKTWKGASGIVYKSNYKDRIIAFKEFDSLSNGER